MATKTAMYTDMVNINQETLFNKVKFPYLVPVEDLKHIHPYIKSLFCARKIPNVQLEGRLKTFIGNWKILTNNTQKFCCQQRVISFFMPYQHFKMEGLYCLRNILKKGDQMFKVDLKDAYFSVSLNPASRNLFGFLGQGSFTSFFAFVLDQAQHQ